jgi:hypothetical protein
VVPSVVHQSNQSHEQALDCRQDHRAIGRRIAARGEGGPRGPGGSDRRPEPAREQFAALPVRDFAAHEPIALGALIELEDSEERLFYFLGPCAGGTEVSEEGRPVQVITAQSPLGRQLLGKRVGERLPNAARVATVL